MPEGVFSILYGRGISVGQALVKHPALRAVGFTGSRAGGRALMDAAAARPQPIPVYAEMSSVNPIFIMPEALRQRWGDLATGLHQSFTLGVGQFCTKPGLVFLTAGKEADHFVEKLKGLTANTAAGTMLNHQIRENFLHKRDRLVGIPTVGTVSEGGEAQAGLFMTTASTFLENGLLHEEVFGPVTLLVLCRHATDLINCAEALEGQLTATIHSDADDWAAAQTLRFILQEKAGRLIHNGFPTGLEVSHATVHGGPFPATSDGRSTSVGSAAITRWTRSICYQNFPDSALPPELQNNNPWKVLRLVDGQWQTA
jgi:NADP-dependent aldehyde dehydrogenase